LKTQATEGGSGTIEQGFKRAENGWHIVEFQEGIAPLTNKEDEEVLNKQGDLLWKIPMKVNDEQDVSDEVDVDCIAGENAKGEQMLVDFLGAVGLFGKFAKAFPGDESIFDKECMKQVKTRLPGEMMRIKTEQNEYTDGKGDKQTAVNIVAFGKMSDSVKELEAALFPGKGSGSAGTTDKIEEGSESTGEAKDPFAD